MAERRMFARSIVTSDSFLDMPSESQALYLQLCMAADDDGFVDNPRAIMRSCGASNDSMKVLIQRKFVLTFDKGDMFLLVIKHWRVNNYIQRDRYHETKYRSIMRELYFDENKSYSTNPDGHQPCISDGTGIGSDLVQNRTETGSGLVRNVSRMDTGCIQDVSKMDTQVRLGKDSIVKDSIETGEERVQGETTGDSARYCVMPEGRIEWLEAMIRLTESGGGDPSKLENWKLELMQLKKFYRS